MLLIWELTVGSQHFHGCCGRQKFLPSSCSAALRMSIRAKRALLGRKPGLTSERVLATEAANRCPTRTVAVVTGQSKCSRTRHAAFRESPTRVLSSPRLRSCVNPVVPSAFAAHGPQRNHQLVCHTEDHHEDGVPRSETSKCAKGDSDLYRNRPGIVTLSSAAYGPLPRGSNHRITFHLQ